MRIAAGFKEPAFHGATPLHRADTVEGGVGGDAPRFGIGAPRFGIGGGRHDRDATVHRRMREYFETGPVPRGSATAPRT